MATAPENSKADDVFAASPQQVNILVVIDTEYVKAHYPPNSSISSPDKPPGIDHNSQFMICTGSRGAVTGQGTADLSFKANVGDNVSFTGVSIYDNSDDAVIIYGIQYWNGDKVFNQFVPNVVTRKKAVFPNPETSNGLPPLQEQMTFATYDAKVARSGKENFYVYFALYKLSDDGQSQNLYGYYCWDPQIIVP
ncbi:inclusion body family protein (plasmid) [Rhizobium leguminosarum]|uniref:DNA-directed RNA polymerase subunit beta n=2 Tax=Rhizobium TaxID=379 RepID=A0A179BYJ4_RHILE|nr:inclusion body family protein [Rhizobium leguminosarum]OAP96415.1 DNA-directed RNA polymerase subunit beta [Rhizobium leguminosarum]UIK01142.1 inclusion body family protein [Rhizobium leguminosarum]UIL30198.1 inclusion body family protein [Rhizobium leguminosarum]WFT89459.1 inclusion body family protein [Rhizobium leguminosarum]